jgi:glyoxylase-like metal-dependent hydrolase (beta-lactamase superfamily II)
VHPGDVREDPKGRLSLHYPGQIIARDWPLPFLQRLHADGLMHHGEVLPVAGGMEMIHTPGHTPGSVVLYQRDRGLLFTGDSLLSNGKVFRRPLPFPGTDFKAYRRSVERIAQLDFETALVGHGRPIIKGGRSRVEEMLQDYSRAFVWGRVLGALRLGSGRRAS